MCVQNLKFVDVPVAIGVLAGAANPNLGEEKAVGGRNGAVRKSVGEFL